MADRMTLPVLPLREVVLFPGVTTPIGAGRPGTVRAIEAALNTPEKLIFALCQRENTDQVTSDGLYTIGTIARIAQVQRGLAGMQLLLHGERRGIAIHLTERAIWDRPGLISLARRVRFPRPPRSARPWAGSAIRKRSSPARRRLRVRIPLGPLTPT